LIAAIPKTCYPLFLSKEINIKGEFDATKKRGRISRGAEICDLDGAGQAGDIHGQERVPDRQITAPLHPVRTEGNAGESQMMSWPLIWRLVWPDVASARLTD
jgi:hypothetical protein